VLAGLETGRCGPQDAADPGVGILTDGLGLGAGGRIRQRIYSDPHGLDAWDLESATRVTVRLLNTEQHRALTGEEPPPSPVTADEYARAGLPWFDLADQDRVGVEGDARLERLRGVAGSEAARIDARRLPVERLRPPGGQPSRGKGERHGE
jgi:hypothetical protein